MLGTFAIRNLIREVKIHQVYTIMELSANDSMRTLVQEVRRLEREGSIDIDHGLAQMYG